MVETTTSHQTDAHETVGFVDFMRSSQSDFGTPIEHVVQEFLLSARDIKSRTKRDHQSTRDSIIDTVYMANSLSAKKENVQHYLASMSAGFSVTQRAIAMRIISRSWNRNEILNALALRGLHGRSNRLRDLCYLHEDDPDEPTVIIESLRACAQFFLNYSSLNVPEIGLTPDGLLLIEWASEELGVAAMVFRPSGRVQFAAVSTTQGPPRRVHGELTVEEALTSVRQVVPL